MHKLRYFCSGCFHRSGILRSHVFMANLFCNDIILDYISNNYSTAHGKFTTSCLARNETQLERNETSLERIEQMDDTAGIEKCDRLKIFIDSR